jgi:CBS domain containing-hemolysin-like protein
LDDINNIMSIDLPTDESDTLGGLVYAMLGRVPGVGDTVDVAEVRLTVLAVDGRRIGRVKIQCLLESVESDPVGESGKATQKTSTLMGKTHNTVSGSP